MDDGKQAEACCIVEFRNDQSHKLSPVVTMRSVKGRSPKSLELMSWHETGPDFTSNAIKFLTMERLCAGQESFSYHQRNNGQECLESDGQIFSVAPPQGRIKNVAVEENLGKKFKTGEKNRINLSNSNRIVLLANVTFSRI